MKASRTERRDDGRGFGYTGLKRSVGTRGITTHYPVGSMEPEVLARLTGFIILKIQMKVETR